jgi:hypothetical protein
MPVYFRFGKRGIEGSYFLEEVALLLGWEENAAELELQW